MSDETQQDPREALAEVVATAVWSIHGPESTDEDSAQMDGHDIADAILASPVWQDHADQAQRLREVEKYANRCAIMRVEPSTGGLRAALATVPAPTPDAYVAPMKPNEGDDEAGAGQSQRDARAQFAPGAWFPDGQQGYSIALCACDGGPYLGARQMGTPCVCERCRRITPDQWEFLVAAVRADREATR